MECKEEDMCASLGWKRNASSEYIHLEKRLVAMAASIVRPTVDNVESDEKVRNSRSLLSGHHPYLPDQLRCIIPILDGDALLDGHGHRTVIRLSML